MKPTATPPTATTLFAQSSRTFPATMPYWSAKESAPQPVPADWLYLSSVPVNAFALLS
ncbi:hypothetical protein [Streptomyces sp. NPDC088256]|uniref:hypothetical protein n=1 Tax=Streptomyces sp. NPDC088256 TaxID=3365848 RepID=UPI003806BE04